jgi:hypothetical protein
MQQFLAEAVVITLLGGVVGRSGQEFSSQAQFSSLRRGYGYFV